MYLLDTNHCSRIIFQDPDVLQTLTQVGAAETDTSVIVQGELLFMALKSERVNENLRRVEEFLTTIRIFGVDAETAATYAQLKIDVIRHFWIAATAIRHGLTLVSADTDYKRMAEAHSFPLEAWWIPPA